MQIKNIPRNIPRYTRKAMLWRRNSYPFLSGDLFSDQADISFFSPKFRRSQPKIREIAQANVIFCPSHDLEKMLDEYGQYINAKVLILGNSDRDFDSFEFSVPSSIKRILAQNLSVADSRSLVLPIGIENLRLATNGLPNLFTKEMVSRTKEKKVLVGPLGITHPERLNLYHHIQEPGDTFEIKKDRLTPMEYANFSSNFRFIASPRGNGLDTHRFWEALYRGSHPLVLDNSWARSMEAYGIPLIRLSNWSRTEVEVAINSPRFSTSYPARSEAIWWPYWRKMISETL